VGGWAGGEDGGVIGVQEGGGDTEEGGCGGSEEGGRKHFDPGGNDWRPSLREVAEMLREARRESLNMGMRRIEGLERGFIWGGEYPINCQVPLT